MARGVILFVFLAAILILIIPNLQAQVTGEVITGKATQSVGMNITVIAYFPSLSIISPQNQTYLTNESVLLDYSATNEETVWYNLDNLDNTTITSSIRFNTSQGSHTLYLYANSSFGNLTTRNVIFFINSSSFVIIDDKFDDGGEEDSESENKKEDKKGDSTDFLDYSYEELQNLSNVIFEDVGKGKIIFNEAINLTDDENPSDNILNIDDNINISWNRIEINSTGLPNFNKSATLELYNLAFSNPRILRDGSVCPSTICTKQSYSGGTLIFNITGFTIYSAEETPIEEIPFTPSGGGSSRTWIEVKKDFSISSKDIKVLLKQGETLETNLVITNTGTKKLKFKIEISEVEEFIKINKKEFELDSGVSEIITLDFLVKQDTPPNLYLGFLTIKAENIEKQILVAVEVESKDALFDVKAEIPEKFLYVSPGEEILVSINLYNLGGEERINTDVEYTIKNGIDDTLINESETVDVEVQTSFIKTFKIPKDTREGDYVFYVKTTYNGKTAGASAWFRIGEKPFLYVDLMLIITIIVLLIIFVLVIVFFKCKKLKTKNKSKRFIRKHNGRRKK